MNEFMKFFLMQIYFFILYLSVALYEQGPQTKCVNDSCDNHGRCVQQWTSYKCDCDMTSYTGPMCKNGTSFIFFLQCPSWFLFLDSSPDLCLIALKQSKLLKLVQNLGPCASLKSTGDQISSLMYPSLYRFCVSKWIQ